MLISFQTPPPAEVYSMAELPLLPGSDPLLLDVYRWTLAHSPSLQQVVRHLAKAERKARYRLVPGLDVTYGRLLIITADDEYQIDIQVPVLPWRRCGDALEPWIATALFLAMETATTGDVRETRHPHQLRFIKKTELAAFAFQAKVKKELMDYDPGRLKDLPDGSLLYQRGFPPVPGASKSPSRRLLPHGLN